MNHKYFSNIYVCVFLNIYKCIKFFIIVYIYRGNNVDTRVFIKMYFILCIYAKRKKKINYKWKIKI